jgi:hypothetical protein
MKKCHILKWNTPVMWVVLRMVILLLIVYVRKKHKVWFLFQVNVPQSIEHMCFPDARDWYNRSSEKTIDENVDEDRCYVIPLTNEVGLRKFAYCRRIRPEGESFSLPLSYCILSGHKANKFYFSVRHLNFSFVCRSIILNEWIIKFSCNNMTIERNFLPDVSSVQNLGVSSWIYGVTSQVYL